MQLEEYKDNKKWTKPEIEKLLRKRINDLLISLSYPTGDTYTMTKTLETNKLLYKRLMGIEYNAH